MTRLRSWLFYRKFPRLSELAAICWAVFAILAVFGVGYVTLGKKAAAAPGAYEFIVRYLPADLHTYGAVLLALAALLLHGLLPTIYGAPVLDWWLRGVARYVAGFAFLNAWLFAWSWALSGTPTWQYITVWLVQCGLCVWAARWNPPPTPEAVLTDRAERVA